MTVRDLGGDDADEPRASLAGGAGGVAYVLARIGHARRDTQVIGASKRWLAIARRAARARSAFQLAKQSTRASVAYGPLGLDVVAAISSPTSRAVKTYLASSRRRITRGPAEYHLGIAGHVFAAIEIARASGDGRALALVGELAKRLQALATPPSGGFAHGDIGVTAALLAAARASGASPDPSLVASLAAVDPARVLARGASWFARSWCNGLAGYVLAWVLAAEFANDERCRDHAIASGPHLIDELEKCGGTLCCGLGGRAYALLAIARLDPEGPWIDHARRLAKDALSRHVNTGGLHKGLPGLVLLAHELQSPATARFPLVEV